MELTAVLTSAEEGGYVALNPETGTTTQGETVEEAVTNLQEATALYLSEFPLATAATPWPQGLRHTHARRTEGRHSRRPTAPSRRLARRLHRCAVTARQQAWALNATASGEGKLAENDRHNRTV